MEPQMNTDKHRFLFKEETHRIIGCAFEILNTLGHGLLEKPYENALVVEFQQQGIPYTQQPRFPVIYKSVQVGEYIPDLIVFDRIIVDTKVIEKIGNNEKAQIINYLKITGLRVGLLLNFKHAKLEWERIIL
ncbi:MAG: GxxExxY protein [Desulfobacterium sp.]|jgi:GxxExxY protein|nr:GxxExxY protein [Desulfobacterium sp.]